MGWYARREIINTSCHQHSVYRLATFCLSDLSVYCRSCKHTPGHHYELYTAPPLSSDPRQYIASCGAITNHLPSTARPASRSIPDSLSSTGLSSCHHGSQLELGHGKSGSTAHPS